MIKQRQKCSTPEPNYAKLIQDNGSFVCPFHESNCDIFPMTAPSPSNPTTYINVSIVILQKVRIVCLSSFLNALYWVKRVKNFDSFNPIQSIQKNLTNNMHLLQYYNTYVNVGGRIRGARSSHWEYVASTLVKRTHKTSVVLDQLGDLDHPQSSI